MQLSAAVSDLSAAWGFVEEAVLRALHVRLVTALKVGAPVKELWGQYLDAAHSQLNFPQEGRRTDRARMGLAIAQAKILLEAAETVDALNQLLFVEAAARHQGYPAEQLLTDEISRHGSQAEYLQAEAYFCENAQELVDAKTKYLQAIVIYVVAESDDSLTDAHRGLINHHLAECYLGLRRLKANSPEDLAELIVTSLQSAADYRTGLPERAKTLGLIAQLELEAWWLPAFTLLEE